MSKTIQVKVDKRLRLQPEHINHIIQYELKFEARRQMFDDLMDAGSPSVVKFNLSHEDGDVQDRYLFTYSIERVQTETVRMYESPPLPTKRPDTVWDKLLAKFGLYRKR